MSKSKTRVYKPLRNKALKGEAVLSIGLVALSFVLSPITGILMLIYRLFNLSRFSSMQWIEKMRTPTLMEELLWLGIAFGASTIVPLPIGIMLILWRGLKVIKASTGKKVS